MAEDEDSDACAIFSIDILILLQSFPILHIRIQMNMFTKFGSALLLAVGAVAVDSNCCTMYEEAVF